jgi:hypothetical protein
VVFKVVLAAQVRTREGRVILLSSGQGMLVPSRAFAPQYALWPPVLCYNTVQVRREAENSHKLHDYTRCEAYSNRLPICPVTMHVLLTNSVSIVRRVKKSLTNEHDAMHCVQNLKALGSVIYVRAAYMTWCT